MQGWQGQNCSQDVNECDSTVIIPCSGNGFCTNEPGTFACKCLTGFSGNLCDQFTNTCNDIKCFNNATCAIRDEGPVCECPGGWSGLKCETDVDECESQSPCFHSGTCTNTDGSFRCSCYSGWTGNLCTFDVNECLDSTKCSNNGSCTNVPGTYHCACQNGWQGMSCEVAIPGSLQGGVLAFTFEGNITLEYQQPMVSFMYHFLTTYVCSGQDVLLLIKSFATSVLSITASCDGVSISNKTIIDGLSRVPNETRSRLFPLPYVGVRQTSTFAVPAQPNKSNSLSTPAIIGIVVSSMIFVAAVATITVVYFKRRKTNNEGTFHGTQSDTPYYKMDVLDE